MIRSIIVRFFKIIKSLLNLFLSLVIKSIITFSFIFLIKKYYSYFKIIFNTLKKFNHYYIFKYFIKSLAIFNILLAGFTIFILADYQHHDYITLIEQNFINLNENDLFIKIRKYLNRIYKYISDLFYPYGEYVDKEENIITDQNIKTYKNHFYSYKEYYIFGLMFTSTSIIIYNNIIDISPIITTITSFFSAFFSSLFGRGDDDDDTPDSGNITFSDNRKTPTITITEATDISTTVLSIPSNPNTIFYTNESGDKAKALNDRLNQILSKK